MKIFQYRFQTTLMVIWLFSALLMLYDQGFFIMFILFQVVIGVVHLIGSIILMIHYKARSKWVNIHFFGTLILFAAIGLTFALDSSAELDISGWLIGSLVFVVPWIFAIYFWYLSKRHLEGSL